MKKILSLLLAILMIASLSVSAFAGNPSTNYIDIDGTEKYANAPSFPTETTVVQHVGDKVICLGESGKTTWYCVKEDMSLTTNDVDMVYVYGDVNIILCDGKTLTIDAELQGIGIDGNSSLTIYGQSAGTGVMNVSCCDNAMCLSDSVFTVNGGNVNVMGTSVIGVGIYNESGDGEIIVNKGTLTVTGGTDLNDTKNDGGNAFLINGGTLKVNGGTMIAIGGAGNSGKVEAFYQGNVAISIASDMEIVAGDDASSASAIAIDANIKTTLGDKHYVKVYAAQKDEVYLDLDTTTANILDNHKIEQNYTLTESEEVTYTELSKVKLEWEVKDVAITATANKTWDSENLKWVDGDDTFEAADTDVSFKLTNLGTEDVTAKVEFEQSEDLPEETAMLTEADFPITKGTVKSKAVSENADNTLTLAGDITVDATKFAEVTAESGLLGTYTVTISPAVVEYVPGATFKDGESNVFLTWEEVMKAENGTKYGYHPEYIVDNAFTNDGNVYHSTFYKCLNLISIVVPETITGFGENDFDYCSNLESAVFLGERTELSTCMFQHCSNLKTVVLPKGITKINTGLFNLATNLATIDIPLTVTEINGNAFSDVNNLVINYEGTKAQWDAITKTTGASTMWNGRSTIKVVCSDETYVPFSALKATGNVYSYTVAKNSTQDIAYYMTPTVNDESELEWTTSDKDIATVDQNGKVTTYNKGGSVKITVKSKKYTNIYVQFTVNVPKDENDYLASATTYSNEVESGNIMNISLADAHTLAKSLATSTGKTVFVIYYYTEDVTQNILYASSKDSSATEHEVSYYDLVDYGDPVTDSSTQLLYFVHA